MTALPPTLASAEVSTVDDALERVVTSGTVLTSGLATSEPTAVYARLWDHVRQHDITDLEIRQGLFMAAHPLLLGDELAAHRAHGTPLPGDDSAVGRALAGIQRVSAHLPVVGDDLEGRIGDAADQLAQLRLLTDHFDQLEARDIRFTSAFLGPASNTILPDIAPVRAIAPRWAGRNRVSGGLVDYQPVHFPDAAWALSHRVSDGAADIDVDVHVVVTTEPRDGRLSFGMSNGVDGDVLAWLHEADTHLLLLLSSTQPWIEGLPWAPNTIAVDELAPLVEAGRLTVVRDDTPVPALPRGSFDATEVETTIGRHVADHIGDHLDRTRGRALQVGIGGTGVQAIRGLADGPWTGRGYTEMLDPVTWQLVESGTITGTHSLHDGRREELDGSILCTFALGEEGDGFPETLDGNDRVLLAPATHVLQEHAFHGGLGVNNILGIDFNGQVNAFSRGSNPWSGIGGQATIMRGLAIGGIAYLCMKSTYRTPDGQVHSAVMPALPEGTPVALTGPDLFGTRDDARVFLATEHGIACINARSRGDFVRQVISVAHPDHRDDLAAAAWDRHRIRV